MSQEAKIIALEHIVFQLLKELDLRHGLSSDMILERALGSIQSKDYPGDPVRAAAASGALKDAWAFLGKK
ncbi:hypothetical protein SAMN04490182_2031 [Pseudomonas cedrina]|uniref:Uncharacterized protein n=2 Tax=Pseudomonas cedrina TaxID=651740 RepID=A0A1V2JZR9_PSECE|nr:hypothetical protein [Pseudomonas cedrina]ONH50938.1 hypothetical protein BLL36_23805 [Pseudomonas cedrina subsp. cedrina]SDS64348.1 hypothetical protein SAMN04490182_2031 [Pseudomonas cedrina]